MEISVTCHRSSFYVFSCSRVNGRCYPGDVVCSGTAGPNPALATDLVGGPGMLVKHQSIPVGHVRHKSR